MATPQLARALAAALAVGVLAGCGTTVPLHGTGGLSSSGLGTGDLGSGDPGAAAPGQAGTSAPGAVATGGGAVAGGPAPVVPGRRVAVAPGGAAPAAGPSAAAAVAGTLPPTGRGWTRTTISVGYTTENDFNKTAAASGYSSINAGDQVGDIEAVLKAINAAGGLFGRRLVGVDKDNSAAEVSSDPNAASAADCAYFLQDKPVVAVLNLETALDTATFRSCAAKNHLPVMSLSVQPITQSILSALQGYLIPLLTPTYDRLAPVLVQRLTARGYFTGWNASTATASSATPVRTGLLVSSDSQGDAVLAQMEKALGTVGQKPLVFRYAPSGSQQQSDFQSAVLQFRSAGVTHVLSDGVNVAVFMIQAASQSYRPRYAVSSYSAPQPFLEGLAPASQLVGAVGVGSAPTLDVDASMDPGPTPGSPYCTKVLAAGGQTFSGKRFAQAVAFALCDGLRALVAAANAGGGLTGPQLVAGFASAGPTFPTSFAFRSGLAPGNSALPGAGRDLRYDSGGCSCFRYSGSSYGI